jgi:hypothetical protein
MPQSIQDFVYQLVSTSGLGYVSVLLIKMYRIYPALPLLPVIIVAIIIHLVIKSGQEKDRFGRLKSIVPLASDTPSSKSKDMSNSKQVVPIINNNNNNNNNNTSHVTRRQSVIAAIKVSDMLLQQEQLCTSKNGFTKTEPENDVYPPSTEDNELENALLLNDALFAFMEDVSSSDGSDFDMELYEGSSMMLQEIESLAGSEEDANNVSDQSHEDDYHIHWSTDAYFNEVYEPSGNTGHGVSDTAADITGNAGQVAPCGTGNVSVSEDSDDIRFISAYLGDQGSSNYEINEEYTFRDSTIV